MNRLTVAELKQLVERPDVVEMHDVTAQDPRLLVYLKVYITYKIIAVYSGYLYITDILFIRLHCNKRFKL